jgi:large subunit ribosomal protein L10
MGDFVKDNNKLDIKMVLFGGKLLPAEDISKLAKMPTKDQVIGILMGIMKVLIEKFVCTLVAPTSKMVRTLAAVRDAKDAA